jgi:hypothetical protein
MLSFSQRNTAELTLRGKPMNKISRVLTIAGMGLLAGAAMGAGPAQAAVASGQSTAKPAVEQVAKHNGHDRQWVAGRYRSLGECKMAERIAERFNSRNDYHCDRTRHGFRRGSWVLIGQRDRDWFRPGHGSGHGFGNGHGHGHGSGHGFGNGHGPRNGR